MPAQRINKETPPDHSLTAAMKDGALGTVANLVEGIARIGEEGGDYLERKLPLSGLSEEELQQRQLEGLFRAAEWLRHQQDAIKYQPKVNFDQVKDDPLNLPQAGRFIVERGVRAVPEMIAGKLSPAGYFISRTNDIANDRAENDNRKGNATLGDMVKAAPGAVAESAVGSVLGRLMPRGPVSTSVLARIGSQALRQAGAEAFDEVASYSAGSIGTQKGFDPAEAYKRAATGVLVGGPISIVTGSAGEAGSGLHSRLPPAMRDLGGRGKR